MEKNQIDKIKKVSETLLEEIKSANYQGDKVLRCCGSQLILGSRKGPNREINQDRLAIIEISNKLSTGSNLVVAVLSDGMGGMSRGELAASTTISAFAAYIALANANGGGLNKLLKEASLFANQIVYEQFNGKSGATLSAVVYSPKGAVCVNIGDSRVYFFDEQNKTLQLTSDDTLAGQVNIVKDEKNIWFEPNLMDNRLAQHVGMGEGLLPHIIDLSKYWGSLPSQTGFFITSDGTHYIGKEMIEKIIENCADLYQVPKRLLSVSEYLSGHDNSSIIMLPSKINVKKTTGEGNIRIKTNTISDKTIFIIPPFPERAKGTYKPKGIFDNQNKKQDTVLKKKNEYESKTNLRKKKSKTANKKIVKEIKNISEEMLDKKNEIKIDIVTVEKMK